ncbi:MAG TPA: LysM peptidoglycan-binding domain-containing protein [Chloroflexota bacterium]|jgi:LysM repeat protein|nr:LysM peptidoglycan-binding domain-containing protein [Chloroflexota bacterium]
MQRRASRQRSDRVKEWRAARPPAESGWALRLRFFCIAVSFAVCTWAGLRAMSGRVSFAWLVPVAQQAQALVAPLQQSSRGLAFPTVGGTSGPLVQQGTGAQGAPTPAARPTVAVNPVVVIVPTATPTTATAPTPVQPLAVVATATVQQVSTATAHDTAAPATLTPVASTVADLLAGPHTTYVVHAGDTLYGIARRVGVKVDILAAMNHLAPPYKIIVGKSLLIPAA